MTDDTPDGLMNDLSLDKDLQEYILAIQRETGQLPSWADLFLYYEAKASIAIDKDSEVQTFHD